MTATAQSRSITVPRDGGRVHLARLEADRKQIEIDQIKIDNFLNSSDFQGNIAVPAYSLR